MPNAETLEKLATWLDVPISSLLGEQDQERNADESDLAMPEVVEVHLRADKNLSPKSAQALARMFRLLYDQFLELQDETGENL